MAGQQKTTTRKAGDHYWLSYISPVTGKRRRLRKSETGLLPTKEIADAWAAKFMQEIIRKDLEKFHKGQWRTNTNLVKLLQEFQAYKKLHTPRSYKVVMSSIRTYVLPYFVTELGLKNPNEWHTECQRFKGWLLTPEAMSNGKTMAVGTANGAINAYNKFTEWLRDHARELDWNNCRPLQAYPTLMVNRRGAEDLLDNDEFTLIAAHLRTVTDLYADMWLVQRHTGMRVNELNGLSLKSLTSKIPAEITAAFEGIGLVNPFGAIYLESQPADPYVKRKEHEIERKPLKDRPEIAPRYSRTIPIYDKDVWNILARRFDEMRIHFAKGTYGNKKDNYILFDGAQTNHYLSFLREAYDKTGLRPKTTHFLRHTRITELTILGLPDKIEEIVMGHKDLARQKYQHIVEVLNRKTQEEMDFDSIKVVG